MSTLDEYTPKVMNETTDNEQSEHENVQIEKDVQDDQEDESDATEPSGNVPIGTMSSAPGHLAPKAKNNLRKGKWTVSITDDLSYQPSHRLYISDKTLYIVYIGRRKSIPKYINDGMHLKLLFNALHEACIQCASNTLFVVALFAAVILCEVLAVKLTDGRSILLTTHRTSRIVYMSI
jgi:hypothetical protein